MEPLGVPSRTVCVDKLPRWGSACTDLNSNLASGPENAAQLTDRSPFTCRPDVNKKIVLWVGEVALLDCQAVVNTTSERLSDRNPVNESVRAHAGPQLHEELHKLQGCRTGEVRITKGCSLAARFILHTVGPRFDPRYRTAAEMQLHHCYRQALLTAMERGLTSLGLCIINTERRGFPPEDAAHIALRTVRRFLENNPEGLSTVVFAVSNTEQALYSRLLPLYFPRSPGEEVRAHALLPQEVGDSNGEPLLPDRQIRISDSPLGGDLDGHEESDEDFELSRPGHHPFAQMEGNHDRLRHLSLQAAAKTHKGPVNTIRERGYQQWLQQARTEDLSDIAALRAFYQAGVDSTGCPVVAIIGKNIPVSTIDLEKALLYFIRVMDPVASSQFILLCFLTGADPGDRLGAAFLRRICATLHYKYHRNLKAVYIVHPSLWSKVLTWFLAMSVAGLRGRVCNISQLHQLFVHIPLSHIDIPQFVWDYDHRITGESNVAEHADPADPTDAAVGL